MTNPFQPTELQMNINNGPNLEPNIATQSWEGMRSLPNGTAHMGESFIPSLELLEEGAVAGGEAAAAAAPVAATEALPGGPIGECIAAGVVGGIAIVGTVMYVAKHMDK